LSIDIIAVGDLMLGEQPLCHNFGVDTVIDSKGQEFLFKNVKTIFSADLVFGNLEAPISETTCVKGQYGKYFRAKPNVVEMLKSHFNVLSIANNHMMEHCDEAFLSTIDILEKNEIYPLGIKDNFNIINIKGYNILFLSYSLIDDGVSNVLYNKISQPKIIVDAINQYKEEVDLIIVAMHWGEEYVPFPSPKQVEIGRCLIDSGADVILGCHSHVLQSYEIYNSKPIIYGLGNFIFDHTYIRGTEISSIFKITVNFNEKSINISYFPIICSLKDYAPKLAKGDDKDLIIKKMEKIRSFIENNSTEDYIAYLTDYEKIASKYQKSAKKNMMLHFIKNINKYPFSLSKDILTKYVYAYLNKYKL